MIAEFTIFVSLATYHIMIGAALLILLRLFLALIKVSPELRSWLWLTAFIMATIVPVTLIEKGNNQVNQSLFASKAEQSTSVEGSLANLGKQLNGKKQPALDSSDSFWIAPTEVIFHSNRLLKLFCILWILGSLWRCYQLYQSHRQTSELAVESQTSDVLEPLAKQHQIKILESDKISSPSVIGLFEPKVIIPSHIIKQFSLQQLIPIVLHEVAHIQRRDTWASMLQELIAVIFWWSPIIRILNKRIHIDRELACDLRAAKKISSKLYAQSLVDCARIMVTKKKSILAMGLFSQKKELLQRVEQVLMSRKIIQPSAWLVLGVCLTLSLITVGATQSILPKVSLVKAKEESRQYSSLTKQTGQQLIEAVLANDIETIRSLQTTGVDINMPVDREGTALMIAVKEDNREMVEALIQLGANVNQASLYDGNPLIVAAMRNNIELAQLLIENGANVNAIVTYDETPLINATRGGYLEMTKLLVNQGADVNLAVNTGFLDGSRIRSPLNMAKSAEIRQFLIAKGAAQ
ncbi:M56 family metallopeptidase [Aliikangiella sp. IMCC44653]